MTLWLNGPWIPSPTFNWTWQASVLPMLTWISCRCRGRRSHHSHLARQADSTSSSGVDDRSAVCNGAWAGQARFPLLPHVWGSLLASGIRLSRRTRRPYSHRTLFPKLESGLPHIARSHLSHSDRPAIVSRRSSVFGRLWSGRNTVQQCARLPARYSEVKQHTECGATTTSSRHGQMFDKGQGLHSNVPTATLAIVYTTKLNHTRLSWYRRLMTPSLLRLASSLRCDVWLQT